MKPICSVYLYSCPPVAVYSRLDWDTGQKAKVLPEILTCLTADLREASRSSWKRAKCPREAVFVSVLHSPSNRYSLPLLSVLSLSHTISPSSLPISHPPPRSQPYSASHCFPSSVFAFIDPSFISYYPDDSFTRQGVQSDLTLLL